MRHTLYNVLLTVAVSLCTCLSGQAQDLMARQAPIDRQLKTVDSVSLERAIRQETSQYVSSLYPNWTHDHVNAYREVPKPATFKIDLRNFTMPTPSRQITSHFGYRPAFRRKHFGLDIKVYTGDTIYAAFSGKARIVSYDRGGFGYYVVLRHPNGLETIYGHLSKQLVAENEVVTSGQPIGLGGSTGRSTGSHLHFETRLLGEAIDPELLFDFPNQDVTGDYYVYHHENGDGDTRLAETHKTTSEEEIAKSITAAAQPATDGARAQFYKVKRGDTLYSIAHSVGLTVDKLCALNGISSRSRLRQGQILKFQ